MRENTNDDWRNATPRPDPALDEYVGVLREYGLFSGSPAKRHDTALRLSTQGLSVKDLRRICVHQDTRGRSEDQTAAAIGFTLKTHLGWKSYLEDMSFTETRRAARGGKRDSRGKLDEGPRNERELKWKEAEAKRQRDFALERVIYDGHSVAEVAEQVGQSEELVQLRVDDAVLSDWQPDWMLEQQAEAVNWPPEHQIPPGEPSAKRAQFYRMMDELEHATPESLVAALAAPSHRQIRLVKG